MNLENIASIATAIGVCVAAWQIWEGRKFAKMTFEDSFNQQYRNLIFSIPVNALLGKNLSDDEKKKSRELIFNYLDLCNEQIALRKSNRIGIKRWNDWVNGIEENVQKPLFCEVWSEIKKSAPNTFTYLEKLEAQQFRTDPRTWKNV